MGGVEKGSFAPKAGEGKKSQKIALEGDFKMNPRSEPSMTRRSRRGGAGEK